MMDNKEVFATLLGNHGALTKSETFPASFKVVDMLDNSQKSSNNDFNKHSHLTISKSRGKKRYLADNVSGVLADLMKRITSNLISKSPNAIKSKRC